MKCGIISQLPRRILNQKPKRESGRMHMWLSMLCDQKRQSERKSKCLDFRVENGTHERNWFGVNDILILMRCFEFQFHSLQKKDGFYYSICLMILVRSQSLVSILSMILCSIFGMLFRSFKPSSSLSLLLFHTHCY